MTSDTSQPPLLKRTPNGQDDRMEVEGCLRIGTSGWQYDDWRGAFYPEHVAKRRWLEYYTERFPTVEINATFYRLPTTSAVEGWHRRVPDRFLFAVKGSRYLTHNKKLLDPAPIVANVVERLAPLRHRLGVWLWQLPPSLRRNDARLATFLAALPGDARHAVEFRHRSWYEPEVEDLLRRHNVAWVWLSDAAMPSVSPVTADFVYLRFHGLSSDPTAKYRWDYQTDELLPWADRLRAAAESGCDGWVYFNNDHRAHAPRNAAALAALLAEHVVGWPPAG